MAGAVWHKLNQPLQTVMGFSKLLIEDFKPDDPNYQTLATIKAEIDRIGELTVKIMTMTHYQSKPYLKSKIVDIEQASKHKNKKTDRGLKNEFCYRMLNLCFKKPQKRKKDKPAVRKSTNAT